MSRRVVYIFIVFLILLAGIFLYIKCDQSNQHFSVTFLNVGQGDSALIKFGNGEKMLVDCGIDQKVLQSLGRNLPFYDRTIDYLLVTHPDSDHYGGCAGVLKRYKIKEIITNGVVKPNDPYWADWEKYRDAEKARLEIIEQTHEITIGNNKIKFLSPDPNLDLDGKPATDNNKSIVFTLQNANSKFIFMADAEAPLENGLMNKYCESTSTPFVCPILKSDCIKIGHHGSDSSSGELFLDIVGAQKAIISVGKNTFGHPSLRVLKKLQRVGAEVLRTDRLGDITLP